jgi:5-methylthioadenosine/S-adenosylhomocysteine deaminase
MLATPSDVNIKARWVAPMTGAGDVLDAHTVVIRDGRILDVLPHREAAERYAPRVELERPTHLAMPGLVNARTRLAPTTNADPVARGFWADGALLSVANMLKGGTTCFCEVGCFPRHAAATALAQGLRAVIGLPVAEQPSDWAQGPADYLTRALKLHDEYKGHPSISTRFAPLRAESLGDETLGRLAILAAELDAGLLVSLHGSEHEVESSCRRWDKRPLQRFLDLGLLGPTASASHLTRIDTGDLDLVRRSGAAVTLCLTSGLARGAGVPPIDALGAAPARVSLGSDGEICGPGQDLWSEMRLMALHSREATPASVLVAATRGGAAALGLESETGTLETGKWADLCCVDLSSPATQPTDDPLRRLVFSGGRDLVSDVWVAGRHLLVDGRFTRLDWPELAARLDSLRPPAATAQRPLITPETRP